MKRLFIVLTLGILMLAPEAFASPDPSVDSNATVVHLRQNCNEQGVPIQNCFEDASLLWNTSTGWIWTVRNPTIASPLIVQVGPGVFGGFTCNGISKGNVTVRGSGREISILQGTVAVPNGASIKNCINLSFLDIGLTGIGTGVEWIGTGNGSWTNVDMIGTGNTILYGWNDFCDDLNPGQSVQYIHNSRVRTTGTTSGYSFGLGSQCSQTWFFGGEIVGSVSGTNLTIASGAIRLENIAQLQLYGTQVRGLGVSGGSSQTTYKIVGVSMIGSAEFHSHGGTIAARVLPAAVQTMNAVGIDVGGANNQIHTPGTAYTIEGGTSGTSNRVSGNAAAKLRDVFVWESGKFPPGSTTEATRVKSSRNGNDVWIETDCSSAGNCNGGGNETHLMIYNAAQCPVTFWFDTRTGACRL